MRSLEHGIYNINFYVIMIFKEFFEKRWKWPLKLYSRGLNSYKTLAYVIRGENFLSSSSFSVITVIAL